MTKLKCLLYAKSEQCTLGSIEIAMQHISKLEST